MDGTTFENVREGYIRHVKKVLDKYAEINPTFESISYAIKDIQEEGVRPPFPYIVVDKVTSANDGGWLREVIAGGNGPTFVSEQKVVMTVTCYGDNATDILNILRSLVLDDLIRTELNSLASAKFQYYSNDISDSPKYIKTDFVNGASIDCYFNMLTVIVPPFGQSTIESVEGQGEYYRTAEDPNPIIKPIDIRST